MSAERGDPPRPAPDRGGPASESGSDPALDPALDPADAAAVIRDPLAAAAARWPETVALEEPGAAPLTFRDLDRRVAARAAEPSVGAPLSIRLPPSAEAAVTIHAAVRAGRPLLPLHHGWTRREAAAAVGAVVHPLPPSTAFVLWTSGTSGHPRGVALSLEGLHAVSEGSRARLGLGPQDRWYWALSPGHVGGLALVLRAAWTGARLVPRPSFDASEFVELARRERITHASLVPVMLRRILEAAGDEPAPSALRCLLVGGAGAPAELIRSATAAGWPVALTYGLTEASSQVATAPPERVREEPRMVGRPLPGVEVRLSEDGEIQVRGPTLALGYVGTDEPFPVEDGWLRTGDFGEWIESPASAPELRVTGRRSARIVTGGVNVDPAEVEGVLASHPDVREAAVVGIPDEEWGERVAALVVPAPGPPPDPEELSSFVGSRLASPKVPRTVSFTDEIPRRANGKVDRSAVRARIEATASP